jgi:hypothetical protein
MNTFLLLISLATVSTTYSMNEKTNPKQLYPSNLVKKGGLQRRNSETQNSNNNKIPGQLIQKTFFQHEKTVNNPNPYRNNSEPKKLDPILE